MRALGLGLAIAGHAAVTGCVTDRVLRDDGDGRVIVDEEVVSRAKATTELRRGLPFRRDVPLEVLSSAELTEWLNRYYDQYKANLEVQDRFYMKLGILPPGRDTASVWKGFVGGFAGGIYDTSRTGPDGERGTMLLISDYAWWSKVQLEVFGLITGVDHAYETFLVHELVHALQDQHLRLDRLLQDAPDDDRRMVQKAIIESEANVIGMAHFAGIDLTRTAPRTVFFLFLHYNNLLNGPLMSALSRKTPSFFAKQGLSQYELGLGFVDERLTAGATLGAPLAELSRAAVRLPGSDGAYPESTEQLLFPSKRGAHADVPLIIAPLPVEAPAGDDAVAAEGTSRSRRFAGHEVRDSGVFGALALKHWLEGAPGVVLGPLVDVAVDGWGGDRYELLVDDEGETVIVWRLIGDTEQDTVQLWRAVRDRLVAAHGDDRLVVRRVDVDEAFEAEVRPAPDERRFIRTSRPEHLAVLRRGRAIVVVTGLAATRALAPVVARLFDAAVPEERTSADSAARVEIAAQLERTLEATLRALPPPTPTPLGAELFTPGRTIAVGAQQVFLVDEATVVAGAVPPSFVRLDARWGVRPWLELAGPLAVTAHIARGPLVAGVGVQPLALPFLAPLTERVAGRAIGTIGVVDGDVGLAAQVEARPDLIAIAAELGHVDIAVRASALMRPLPWLVLLPGVELDDSRSGRGAAGHARTLRVGSVLQRGFLDAPLIEAEIVSGLSLVAGGAVTYDVAPPSVGPGLGLTLRACELSAGALLVF